MKNKKCQLFPNKIMYNPNHLQIMHRMAESLASAIAA